MVYIIEILIFRSLSGSAEQAWNRAHFPLKARQGSEGGGDCFRSFHKYPLFIRAVLYYNKTTNMKK